MKRSRFLSLVFCLASPLTAWSQDQTPMDPPPQPVAAEPEVAAQQEVAAKPAPVPTQFPSFAIQGEYEGWMKIGNCRQPYALQVVGVGAKKLKATLLIGRLPGRGTYEFQSAQFTGVIGEDGDLLLKSEGGIELHHDAQQQAFLQHGSGPGQYLARFDRVQRTSSTMGLKAPSNAVKLFVETPSGLVNPRVDSENHLMVGTVTDFPVQSFQLHLEFKIPYQPNKSQQGRGNSGVYIQRRYEIQILDSFGEPNEFNYCGSLYRQRPASLLMSYPPEQWQTYDIWFTPARWSGDQKIANARLTVLHNGVKIHDNVSIKTKTGAGQKEGPNPLPILFQDHGDPVKFRNVWLVHQPNQICP